MKKIVVGIAAAVASMVAAVVPSGAGQHFGVAGDLIAFPPAASASGPAAPTGAADPAVEGYFAWGLVAGVSDTPSMTQRLDTFTGCLQVVTDRGSDYGCIRDFRLPPPVDPLMSYAEVVTSIPSERYPGTSMSVALRFDALGGPAPAADSSSVGDPMSFRLMARAGLSVAVTVQGVVVSEALGQVPVQLTGLWLRGAIVDVCNFHGQPCPRPGSK